jgi:hypothetical protein
LDFSIYKHMKDEEIIEIYKSEDSNEYDNIGYDEFIELYKKNKISFEVYKNRWYYLTILIILIIIL